MRRRLLEACARLALWVAEHSELEGQSGRWGVAMAVAAACDAELLRWEIAEYEAPLPPEAGYRDQGSGAWVQVPQWVDQHPWCHRGPGDGLVN